jgi:cytochrome b6-f complex iron-sulfur subunit
MLAFFQRDPGSGCAVPWQQAEKLFIDPCHGSAYTATGAYVRGPSQRDLDQFDVDVTPNGIIRVNVYDFRLGTNHR